MRRGARWLAAGMVVALVGCGSPAPVPAPTFAASYGEAAASTLATGGALRLPLAGIGSTVNPFAPGADPSATDLWDWYNPVLFSFSPDGSAQRLDQDYLLEVRADDAARPSVVRYHLNPAARFNDGTPFDARAFDATRRALASVGMDGYAAVGSVVQDGEWVVVRLDRPLSGWRGLFQRLMHPNATLDAYRGAAHPEWGAGPYALTALDRGGARFAPNPAWWGARPHLDTVTLSVLGADEALAAFEAGQLDAATIATGAAAERGARVRGAEVRRGSSTERLVVQLNAKTPVLGDERTRRGVLTAIKRQGLANIAFAGLDYAEPLPGSLSGFGFQGSAADQLTALYPEPGPDHAAGWFDQVGWLKWSDGIRVQDGQKLRLRVVGFGDDDRLLAALTQQLRNAGVDAVADLRPRADLAAVVAGDEWDVLVRPIAGVPDGASQMCSVYCSTAPLHASAGMDDRLLTADDPAALEAEALAQARVLPLLEGQRIVVTVKGLANVGASGFATPPKSEVGFSK